jgi:hypothetical protein
LLGLLAHAYRMVFFSNFIGKVYSLNFLPTRLDQNGRDFANFCTTLRAR